MTKTTANRCPVPTCRIPIAKRNLACPKHWFKVPPELRSRVWNTYRRGQEDGRNQTADHLAAVREAIAFLITLS